jgi:hypothetical protein
VISCSRLIFGQVLGLVLLMGRTSSTEGLELLVLRHEVGVRRTNPRPAGTGAIAYINPPAQDHRAPS